MPQPSELDELADPLVAAYRRAWDRIVAEWEIVAADPLRHVRARRLGELARATAAEMRRLDARADGWLRERFPRAYAAGMAVDAPAAEVGWTLAHQAAVELLAGDLFDDLLRATSGVDESVKALVRAVGRDQALASAIEGKTARQAAREMRRVLNQQGLYSVVYRDGSRHGLGEYADVAIRTKTAVAYNEGTVGQHAEVRFFEVFDGPSCGWSAHDDTTLALGLIVDRDEARGFPIAHPNAVLGDAMIEPLGELRAAFRTRWSGPARRVRTATGRTFTVTPHHPVLTGRGWLAAQDMKPGDQLVRRALDLTAGSSPHDDLVEMARAEHVFESLRAVGSYARVVPAADDLHGDGQFCDDEVEVVWAVGHLPVVAHTSFIKQTGEPILERARTELALVTSGRALGLGLGGIDLQSTTSPGRGHVGRVTRPRSDQDADLAETLADDAAADSVICGQLLARGAGQVTLDEIIEVAEIGSWMGHAYDFETGSGTYLTNGILVHNCRRSFGPRPDVVDLAQVRDLAANPLTVGAGQTTPGQRAAQLAQDRARQQTQRNRRVRRARAARRQRRSPVA